MTNSPPPDPQKSQLGFEELVGILVAFSTIGAILAWSLTPKDKGFNLSSLAPSPTSVRPSLPPSPAPEATVSPTNPPSPQPRVLPGVVLVPQPVAPASPSAPETTAGVAPLVIPSPPASPKPVASPSPSPKATPVRFPDVPNDFWARPYIEALAQRGIVKGLPDGKFRPNQPMTRAEFAAQLQKAFDQKPSATTQDFKDVSGKFWASSAIKETSQTGFLRGYPGSIFRPQQRIPRAQVLVALANGLDLKPPASPEKALQVYQDVGQLPKYAIAPVAAASQAGLVVTYPNQKLLKPNQSATRAEAAAWIYQALVQAGKAEKLPIQSAKPSNKQG